jgi:NADH-quinone oxidoreductase subunit N
MTGYALLIPELLVLVGVAWALFAERLPGGDRGAAVAGALLAATAAVLAGISPATESLFTGWLAFDGAARFARVGIALLAAIWLLWTAGRGEGRIREAVALSMLSSLGAMLMCGASELVTLVLALELSTMPAYVLIGYRRGRPEGLEGALKYFLLSMLTSLVMLYGMSFLYGVSGSTRFDELTVASGGSLGLLAVLFTYVGMFAKLSAAPFHYWTPDAYEGAESWTVAFVSTVPKLAGAVAVVRLTAALAPSAPFLGTLLLGAAVASMVLGNLAALTQSDVRRMMAYSGVAHTGYMLLAAASLTTEGSNAAVFYSLAYAVPSLGIMLLVAEEGSLIDDFAGLSQRRIAAAWGVVILLVSLIGIPPAIGFFGKLSLFSAAVGAGFTVWVGIAVLMSVVSAAYYLRLVRSAFLSEGEQARRETSAQAPFAAAAVAICVVATIGLGLAAGPLLAWMGPLGF